MTKHTKYRSLVTFTFYFLVTLHFNFCVSSYTKKSLENFIRKKTVEKSSITILNTANNEINYTWIEYQYFFDDSEHNLTQNDDVQSFYSRYSPNTALNVNFSGEDCANTRGKPYSRYVQSLLEVLSDDLEIFIVNETETMEERRNVDLLTCSTAPPTGSNEVALLNGYNPLCSILNSRYALIYKKQHKAKDIFVLTFVGTLWLCFLVVLLILAVCLRISTYYYSRISTGRRWSWVEITLWAIAAACQQGLSYTPSRITSRIFFLLGYINAYVLYTAFTAAITSVLVQQETVGITLGKYNIIGYGVTESQFGTYKIASHTNNLTKLFEQINMGANIGLGPQILLDISTMSEGSVEHDDYNVIMLDRSVGEYRESFLLRKDIGHQQKLIKQRLIKLFETGILKQLKRKAFGTATHRDSIEGYSSASVEHVKSAILLFLIGLGLSVVFLIMELGVYGYRHRVTEQT